MPVSFDIKILISKNICSKVIINLYVHLKLKYRMKMAKLDILYYVVSEILLVYYSPTYSCLRAILLAFSGLVIVLKAN